jgi:hypothetical protein
VNRPKQKRLTRFVVLPVVGALAAIAGLSGGCGDATPSSTGDSGVIGSVQQAGETDADECQLGLPTDSLSNYYRKCTASCLEVRANP